MSQVRAAQRRQPGARLSAWLAATIVLCAGAPAWSQSGIDASGPTRIGSVSVHIEAGRADSEAGRQLEAAIRRTLGIYPGRSYDEAELDLALTRLRASGLVGTASSRLEFADGETTLVVLVQPPSPAAAPSTPSRLDGLRLIDDGRNLLKLRLGLKGAVAFSGNQWFDNAGTLTQYNPRGPFRGGRGPNGILDLAPSVGLAGAVPLTEGPRPAYAYASTLYLGTVSVGQDNNRNDLRHTGQWEEAYVGLVDGGTTASGMVWRANVSYGMQPYCIGNGMLVCQIASSGGDRGADFGWPRWSADRFLKAQLRLNQTLLEAFSFEPNDFPSTRTRLTGLNIDHDAAGRFNAGFTWLTADKGELKYFFPDGRSQTRDGLQAWQLRAATRPAANTDGPIVKLEYARQTHSRFDMRATGSSAEGGWQFASAPWRPSLTWRTSSTSGDDPATPRYERWDLLYSGGDIDTWVQGQLMKNIHYNSNVRVQRLMLRATPNPLWRVTAAVSGYRADTLNNIGGVISTLADRPLGHEVLLVTEHFLSRQVYWRFTFASLWPGSGVTGALPAAAAKPWLVGITQFNMSF